MEDKKQKISDTLPSEFITVTWNNQDEHIRNQLRLLVGSGSFPEHDLMISCDGGSVKCNKVILAICSQYFEKVFKDNTVDMKTVILLPNTSVTTFRYIYQFMLEGMITLPKGHLRAFQMSGKELKVEGLNEVQMKSNVLYFDEKAAEMPNRSVTRSDDPCSNLLPDASNDISKRNCEEKDTPITLAYLLGHTKSIQSKDSGLKRRKVTATDKDSDMETSDKPNATTGHSNVEKAMRDDVINIDNDADSNETGGNTPTVHDDAFVGVEQVPTTTSETSVNNKLDLGSINPSCFKVIEGSENNIELLSSNTKSKDKEDKIIDASASSCERDRNTSEIHAENAFESDAKSGSEDCSENISTDDSDFAPPSNKRKMTKSRQQLDNRKSDIRNKLKIRSVGLQKSKRRKSDDEDYVLPSTSKGSLKRKRVQDVKKKPPSIEQSKQTMTVCPDCNKRMRLSNLKLHQKKFCKKGKKVEDEKKYLCTFEDCDFSSVTIEEAKAHTESHKTSFECSVCLCKFMNKDNFEMHKATCKDSDSIPDASEDVQILRDDYHPEGTQDD